MRYLRHALRVLLLLTVLALALPSPTSQDNTKSDDGSSQSDRSDDQITLTDFIFELPSVLHEKLPREICLKAISPAPENYARPRISGEPSFLPHVFISACGLMPRAPAPA